MNKNIDINADITSRLFERKYIAAPLQIRAQFGEYCINATLAEDASEIRNRIYPQLALGVENIILVNGRLGYSAFWQYLQPEDFPSYWFGQPIICDSRFEISSATAHVLNVPINSNFSRFVLCHIFVISTNDNPSIFKHRSL